MLTAGGGPRLRVRAPVPATQDVQPPTLHNGVQGNAAPRTPPSTHLGQHHPSPQPSLSSLGVSYLQLQPRAGSPSTGLAVVGDSAR